MASKPLDQGIGGKGTDHDGPRLTIHRYGWDVLRAMFLNESGAAIYVALSYGHAKPVHSSRNLGPVRAADRLSPGRRKVDQGHSASLAARSRE